MHGVTFTSSSTKRESPPRRRKPTWGKKREHHNVVQAGPARLLRKTSSTDSLEHSCSSTEFSSKPLCKAARTGVVQFDMERNVVIPIESIEDYNEREKALLWGNSVDFVRFKGDVNRTASRMIEPGRERPPEHRGFCFRGLENCPGMNPNRDVRIVETVQTVLGQQRGEVNPMGFKTKSTDAESIASVYMQMSRSFMEEAIALAQEDMEAAHAYQKEQSSVTPPPTPAADVVGVPDENSLRDHMVGEDDETGPVPSDVGINTIPTKNTSKRLLHKFKKALIKPKKRSTMSYKSH